MSDPIFESPIVMPELHAGKAEITMAPLIDVVFLLLIFFMIATVFPQNRGIIIEQPQSETSQSLSKKKMTFAIDSTGKIHFQDKQVKLQDVQSMVNKRLKSAPETTVLIQVDRRANTQALISVMDACKKGGAIQLGIATDAIKLRK